MVAGYRGGRYCMVTGYRPPRYPVTIL
jgi:hypothetical protein